MAEITNQTFIRPNPLTQIGDKGHENILYAVGKALSAWEHSERMFARIFSKLVHPNGSGFAAQRTYGEILATVTRRQMIESAAEIFFRNFPNEAAEKELTRLMQIYDSASARRNDLAHGIAGGDDNDAGETWCFLVPNTWGSKLRDLHLKIAYRYSSKQIEVYEQAFFALGARASKVVTDLDTTYRRAPEKERVRY
jgi:hypothetical protein